MDPGSNPSVLPRRAKVLFVDDEPSITTALRRALSRESFEVQTANTIADAFAVLRSGDVAVVVSDERMPEMSGSDFLSEVRKRHPDTMRLILTGHASLNTAIHAVNHAEIFRFLTKPCSTEDLASSIREAISVRQRQIRTTFFPDAIFTPDEMALMRERFDLALEGLWMAVQPVVRVPERTVFGYECLVRSTEPSIKHGGVFVELADRVGRSLDLDRRIRQAVADIIPSMRDKTAVLVNLHPGSLDDPDLHDKNAPLSRFAPRVVLEITERASLHDLNSVREQVASLRSLGYRIAVDDLGAGYAGLTSLALLQPEFVKLDMELVRGISESPTKAKLVSAVVTLCRELGNEVIAEGIESGDEYRRLESLGCTLLQGYYFARPSRPFPNIQWPE
jgi:EAL domain-containing protein (putative c-di-GMP-specific phosphodiesterase class I)